MITVRLYTTADFPMITSWWNFYKEIGPLETMMPLDSSFIVEYNSVPCYCVSLYLTNITEFCYVENFIGNPEITGPARREAEHQLQCYVENFAKQKGYKRLLCMAHREPLKQRYEELGFARTLDSVATFCKILET